MRFESRALMPRTHSTQVLTWAMSLIVGRQGNAEIIQGLRTINLGDVGGRSTVKGRRASSDELLWLLRSCFGRWVS